MRILFVCTGNICRSPIALAIARHQIKAHHLEDKFKLDSAGIKVFYDKEEPDHRPVKLGKEKGISFDNIRARQIKDEDFENNDLILAMTKDHVDHLLEMSNPIYHPKIKLLLKFCKVSNSWHDEVIDPYYGESKDISDAFNIIETAITNLFRVIIDHKKW